MIPADLASRLRLVAQDLPTPVQPVASQQKVADVLSDLTAGQRIMAEIQSLLPNGSYRALVAQREITLALPFAAKAGDTLELEVVETDGKLTLAFIANKTPQDALKDNDSAATSLSKTGNLIGNLLGQIEEQGGKAKPAALNANQPLVEQLPSKASDLAPILKDALLKSGMFYEAHQARWLEGSVSTESLRQEPQGKLPPLAPSTPANLPATADSPATAEIAAHVTLSDKGLQKTASESASSSQNTIDNKAPTLPSSSSSDAGRSPLQGVPVHPDATPIVQQQLNALATQTYVWQGQVWPGQNMQWEITEDDGRPRTGEEPVSGTWQTKLKLNLPNLGGIEARLGLDSNGKLSIALKTNQAESQNTLQAAGSQLEQAMQASGLQLNQLHVSHGEITG